VTVYLEDFVTDLSRDERKELTRRILGFEGAALKQEIVEMKDRIKYLENLPPSVSHSSDTAPYAVAKLVQFIWNNYTIYVEYFPAIYEAQRLINCDQKLNAIRALHTPYNLSLRDAKDIVEGVEIQVR
jgi:hypothetical protein